MFLAKMRVLHQIHVITLFMLMRKLITHEVHVMRKVTWTHVVER